MTKRSVHISVFTSWMSIKKTTTTTTTVHVMRIMKDILPDWFGKCAKLAKLVGVAVWVGGAAKMSPRSESKSNFFSWAALWAWERASPGDWVVQSGKNCKKIKNKKKITHTKKTRLFFSWKLNEKGKEWPMGWKRLCVHSSHLAQRGLIELQGFEGLDFWCAASAACWGAGHRSLNICYYPCLVRRNIPKNPGKSTSTKQKPYLVPAHTALITWWSYWRAIGTYHFRSQTKHMVWRFSHIWFLLP